jgi:hypothetical protein
VVGLAWAATVPVTDSEFALVNRRSSNGVLTWLATAKKAVLLPDLDSNVQLGSNIVIVASIKQIVGNEKSSYGIIFRASSGSRYLAGVNEVGRYAHLSRFKDGVWTNVAPPVITGAVQPGAVNTLVVKGSGTHYTFQINDKVVLEGDDGELTGGSPGIGASLTNPRDNGTWEFSRFEVYAP